MLVMLPGRQHVLANECLLVRLRVSLTTQDNIVFGHQFHQSTYDRLIDALQLTADFDQLPVRHSPRPASSFNAFKAPVHCPITRVQAHCPPLDPRLSPPPTALTRVQAPHPQR